MTSRSTFRHASAARRFFFSSVLIPLAVCFACALHGPSAAAQSPGAYGGKTLQEWIALTESEDDDERRQAYYALGELRPTSPEATAALVNGLEDGAVVGRRYAIASLGEMGDLATEAVPNVIEAITSETVKDDFIKLHGVRTLGRIGPPAKEAESLLRDLSENGAPSIRVAAALSLWRIVADRNAIALLLKELENEADQAPFEAAVALVEIGPQFPETLPALVQALAHSDADVRRAAAKAAASFGVRAIPLLSEATTTSGADPQAVAAALGMIFDQARTTLYDPQTPPKEFLAMAGVLVQGSRAAGAILESKSAGASARQEAGRALAKLSLLATPQLLTTLQGDDPALQAAAIEGMLRIENYLPRKPVANIEALKKNLAPRLLPALENDDPKVRGAAIRLFAVLEFGPYAKDAIAPLRRALREETDGGVRSYASQALNRLLDN